MAIQKVLLVLVAAVVCLAASGAVSAEKKERAKVAVQSTDGIADVIGRYPGRYVIFKLASGSEIVGRVAQVTAKLVYVTEIRGREYYDSVIQLDRIEAVEIRVYEE